VAGIKISAVTVAELAAGGVDRAAKRLAQVHIDAPLLQAVDKRLHGFRRGGLIIKLRDGIIDDAIDIAAGAGGQVGQFVGIRQ
jgi:hypothetical protein